jgi:hypothetical protein
MFQHKTYIYTIHLRTHTHVPSVTDATTCVYLGLLYDLQNMNNQSSDAI